ncbi:MAG: DUF4296 domain-containing protein [Chitinophagaceae bacterium]
MMQNLKLSMLFLLLLFSCKKPTEHLPPSTMAPVLAELHIADAYSTMLHDSTGKNALKNYDSLARWTAEIFNRHHVTMEGFNKSMDWYRDRPLELDSLFAKVIPILDTMKSK